MSKRLTPQVAKVTGMAAKNPQRYRDRANPKALPLGEPEKHLNEAEREAWREFEQNFPWLAKSDRFLVGLASRLVVMVQQPDCPIGYVTQLRLCLSSMGGTPTDKSRVAWSDDDDGDPTDEFLQ